MNAGWWAIRYLHSGDLHRSEKAAPHIFQAIFNLRLFVWKRGILVLGDDFAWYCNLLLLSRGSEMLIRRKWSPLLIVPENLIGSSLFSQAAGKSILNTRLRSAADEMKEQCCDHCPSLCVCRCGIPNTAWKLHNSGSFHGPPYDVLPLNVCKQMGLLYGAQRDVEVARL